MPKTKQQKEEAAKQLSDKIKESKSIMFLDYKGMRVKEIEDVRNECKKQGSEYLVAKKTLMKIAIDNNKIEGVNPKEIDGNLAMVMGYEDEIVPAKILKDASKKYKTLKMLGGIMEGKYLDEVAVKELADLPSKPELLAKVVGSLNAPISGFVNVLHGNLRNLVYVLSAIKDKK